MLRRGLLSLALTAALVPATAACDVHLGQDGFSMDLARGRAEDTWTRSYTLAPGGRLELINVNGSITAEPSDGATVELVGRRTAKATSDEAARQYLEIVEMREEAGDSRVRVEVRPPRSMTAGVEVQWTVRVPKGLVVDLRNVNGRVAATGLEGELHASTVNGGVQGRALQVETLEARTVNGGVDVELAAPLSGQGTVRLEAVNGGVELALPSSSRASVHASVTNGGIRTDDGLAFQVSGEQSRRRFEGTLNGGGTRVRLETTNGGVRLSKSSS